MIRFISSDTIDQLQSPEAYFMKIRFPDVHIDFKVHKDMESIQCHGPRWDSKVGIVKSRLFTIKCMLVS